MPTIGDTLREARMRQKIDISEVEQKTKIRAKYLRALENEEFDLLPGSTFVRSFLKTYAEFLGVDGQLLVEEFRVQYEPREESDLQPITTPAGRPRDRRHRRSPSPGLVAGGLVVAVLALLLVLGLTGDDGEDDEQGVGETAARERRERAQEAAPAGAERRPRRTREVRLRVVPSEATYVCIEDAGGQVIFDGILERPRNFRDRRLRVNLGKTSAALRVNGRAVPIERGPEPVGFEFTPRGRKELPAAQRPCA